MTILKRIGIALTFPSILFCTCMGILYADTIKDLPQPKFPFHEAISALQKGHTIHRAGEQRMFMKRKIEMDGKVLHQYGQIWNDTDFRTSCYLSLEDVMADDWVIKIDRLEKNHDKE